LILVGPLLSLLDPLGGQVKEGKHAQYNEKEQ
jgi:hypothetical protein